MPPAPLSCVSAPGHPKHKLNNFFSYVVPEQGFGPFAKITWLGEGARA